MIRQLSLVLLLLSSFAMATEATNFCGAPIYDGPAILGSKTSQVEQAIMNLDSKGADAHALIASIVDFPTATGLKSFATMDGLVNEVVKQCPSWQSPNHGVKSTLVVLAVDPRNHKFGLYTGTAFEAAFGPQRMNKYRSEFMIPHFKTGDYAGGLTVTANQMAERLAAYTSEANAPVVNQEADYSWLKAIFGWLLFLGASGFAIWAVVITYRKKQKRSEDRSQAQQMAIVNRNTAAQYLDDVGKAISRFGNLAEHPGADAANELLNSATADFTSLSNSASTDPGDNSLPVSSHRAIASMYAAVIAKLNRAKTYLQRPDQDPNSYYPPPTPPTSSTPSQSTSSQPSTPSSPLSPTTPEHHHSHNTTIVRETVVNNNPNNDLLTGIMVGDILSERREERREEPRYQEPEPERREPEPEPERETFSKDSGSGSFEPDTRQDFDSSSSGSGDSGSDSGGFGDSSGGGDF